MKRLTLLLVASAAFLMVPASPSALAAEPATVADYIAELERMGAECEAKLNTGTGADRMWRVCAAVCQKSARDLREWQGDPARALSYAKKRMVKCGNNYTAGVDYEKRVKR